MDGNGSLLWAATPNNTSCSDYELNQKKKRVPLRTVKAFKRKRVGQTDRSVSDNQSSSVTLNELAMKSVHFSFFIQYNYPKTYV